MRVRIDNERCGWQLTSRIANKIYWNIADCEEVRTMCGIGDLDKVRNINDSKAWVVRVRSSFGCNRRWRSLDRGWGWDALRCDRGRVRRLLDSGIDVILLLLLLLMLQ